MEILYENSRFPQNCSLILGFFDGIHLGHQDVVNSAKIHPTCVVTFSKSPSEYFNKEVAYLFSRKYNYKLLEKLGVDYIYEQDFSQLLNLSAQEYLERLIKNFQPISISSGYNHSFGANKSGNSDYLSKYNGNYNYTCVPARKINDEIISSTRIKKLLTEGNIQKANQFLGHNFAITSNVIKGAQIGRKLGFPTANLKYPDKIIKIPYGVYKVKVFNKPAVMNWGIKPTFESEELLEVHIPNYNNNLYNNELEIEILSKIRDEKKFENINDLKTQIKKDIEICLK